MKTQLSHTPSLADKMYRCSAISLQLIIMYIYACSKKNVKIKVTYVKYVRLIVLATIDDESVECSSMKLKFALCVLLLSFLYGGGFVVWL